MYKYRGYMGNLYTLLPILFLKSKVFKKKKEPFSHATSVSDHFHNKQKQTNKNSPKAKTLTQGRKYLFLVPNVWVR